MKLRLPSIIVIKVFRVTRQKNNLSFKDKSGAFHHTPVLLRAKTTMVSLTDKGQEGREED